jgi:8-oxo-dGTP pyrophosphatase MutT (NUDIX family)
MSMIRARQHPVKLGRSTKDSVRTQFGALVWRYRKDKVQVLLIKSRRRKRWIIPKGWPMDGQTPVQAAATEAWEEAGIKGRPAPICIGLYSYLKYPRDGQPPMPCVVAVFPLKARWVFDKYPEADQRKRKWVTLKKAVEMVDDPELAQIIRHFDPRHYRL